MKLPEVKLQNKLLILFATISILPLIIANIIWFSSSRNQIFKVASDNLKTTASDIAHQFENYLKTKAISLTIHSQTEPILSNDLAKSKIELQNTLAQDKDIQELALLDKNGKEILRVTREKTYPSEELVDQSTSLAFKIPTFGGGEKYISQIYFDSQGEPGIYIAIPVVQPKTPQSLENLSTSTMGELRKPGEVLGILKANISLSSLWQYVNNLKIGEHGFAFIVDDKGNIIAHPNRDLFIKQTNFKGIHEVDKFLSSLSQPTEPQVSIDSSVNQDNQEFLSTHALIKPTNWGVVTVVPLSDTFAQTNQIAIFAVVLLLMALVVVVLISLSLSGQIVRPINQLQEGAKIIGGGNLNYKLDIRSHDEIEELGKAFNEMSDKLKYAFQSLETDKSIITGEKNKLAITLSGITDGVIAVDIDGKIVIFNRAAEDITGIFERDAIGRYIDAVIGIYDQNNRIKFSEYCPIRVGGPEGVVFTKQNLKVVGHKQTFVNLIVGQIKVGSTVNLGGILTLHNISREMQLEDLKLDFVAMAAHELRTPLTSLKGYLSVFTREIKNNLTLSEKIDLNRIKISAQQISLLVENLLNVSRIERGMFSITIEPTVLSEIIDKTMMDFEDRVKEKKLTLKFIKPKSVIPYIKVDKLRISEVLSNLVANAINYTHTGGTISIGVEVKEKGVVIHIQDTGEGMPKEALPRLFTKFFRLSGPLEHGSKGTGLGLYICKTIIEMHHGRIWVESEVGRGSTFSFSLPLNT